MKILKKNERKSDNAIIIMFIERQKHLVTVKKLQVLGLCLYLNVTKHACKNLFTFSVVPSMINDSSKMCCSIAQDNIAKITTE